jgi:valyl-tRNA synthetase
VREATVLDGAGPAARAVAAGVDLAVPLAGVLDLAGERRRLQREIEKLAKEQDTRSRKLQNADFLGKARAEVIEKVRQEHRELEERIARLRATLSSLA